MCLPQSVSWSCNNSKTTCCPVLGPRKRRIILISFGQIATAIPCELKCPGKSFHDGLKISDIREAIMGKQRKTWRADQKPAIVLAALRGHHRIAALARQQGMREQLMD